MKYELTARRIREALEDAGMTQQELADLSHVGKSSISHYVNGTNEPGNKSAFMLANVLKVNPTWLMGIDAPKHLIETDSSIVDSSMCDPQELKRALRLYELYKTSIPQVQSAVEALLKPEKPVL